MNTSLPGRGMPTIRFTLIFGTLLSSLAYFAALPFLPLILIDRGVTDPAAVGLTIGAIALIAALGGAPVGALIDRTSPRPFLITGLAMSAVAYLVLAAESDQGLTVTMIIALGIGRALMEPAGKNLLSTLELRAGTGFRWRHAMLSLGAIGGPAVGAATYGFSEQLYFAVPALLYTGYAALLIMSTRTRGPADRLAETPEPEHRGHADRPRRQLRRLVHIVALGILIFTVFSQLSTVFPLLLEAHLGQAGIVHLAALLITNAVLNLIWQFVLARTQSRWSIRTSMIIGTGCFIAALVLFRFGLETVPLLYLGIVFWSAGQAALLPGQEILLHQLTGNAKGLVFGLGELRYLGFFIGPWLGGALTSTAPALYPLIMITICAATLALLAALRDPAPAEAAAPGRQHRLRGD